MVRGLYTPRGQRPIFYGGMEAVSPLIVEALRPVPPIRIACIKIPPMAWMGMKRERNFGEIFESWRSIG